MNTFEKKADAKTLEKKQTLTNMAISYAMGTFNDNFFKQAALLLAATAGLTTIQGTATVFFALPFIVCSAWAGWFADSMNKRSIIIGAKALELFTMLFAIWSLAYSNWTGMIAVIFFMGLQSTFFGPSLNGSIPETFEPDQVPQVNAKIKLVTTASILLGIAFAGMILDLPAPEFIRRYLPANGTHHLGRILTGIAALVIAAVGLYTAVRIKNRPFTKPAVTTPFPWFGPIDSFRHTIAVRKTDKELYLVLLAEGFFYLISSFAVLCINNLGVIEFGFSLTFTSLLSVGLMVGVCIGAIIAGRNPASSWQRLLVPSGIIMGIGLLLSITAHLLPGMLQFVYLLLLFVVSGLCGGMFLIPLVSFMQVRPEANCKGKILGISNFISFSAILISGLLFSVGSSIAFFSPSKLLVCAGLLCIGFMIYVRRTMRNTATVPLQGHLGSVLGTIMRILLSLRYRLKIVGLDSIKAGKGILFLPNHPALTDPLIIYSQLAGLHPRPLADEHQMSTLPGRLGGLLTHAVLIPDLRKDGKNAVQGVEHALSTIMQTLHNGDSILLYPSGHLYRSSKESLGGNSGVYNLLQDSPQQRVVLVRITGMWGSSFSYAGTGKAPAFGAVLLKNIGRLLINGIFFMPRRNVTVEFIEPTDLPLTADKRSLNIWLENFYNIAERRAEKTPYYFWQRRKGIILPEPQAEEHTADTSAVPEIVRAKVYALIQNTLALEAGTTLTESTDLGNDLALDSLGMMELGLALEGQFGNPLPPLENIQTVGDCMLIAAGLMPVEAVDQKAIPEQWFTGNNKQQALVIPAQARTVVHAFVQCLKQAPDAPIAADRNTMLSRKRVFLGAYLLAKKLKEIPHDKIGILLPATPALLSVWMACQIAGKVPVFLNWTVGETNLRHCLAATGITHVLSAKAMLQRLEQQGITLTTLPVEWIKVEELASAISLPEKLLGIFQAKQLYSEQALHKLNMPETAAILFTSGSESLPKAVPLSHENVLTNARDVLAILPLQTDDSIIAMLPPFHSFGLMAGLILPLSMGLRAVYHPNPTEPGYLNGLIHDFKLTLMASPPTFLAAMLERAKEGTLISLRHAFLGAERCPEHVYNSFTGLCPDTVLMEGYGITECSPIVAANKPGSVVLGSIGHALPSVEYVIVKEEDGQISRQAAVNETGMLLVRGPSIFKGYLTNSNAPIASPFVSFGGKDWYRTGDLIKVDETGRFFFQGRLKRFVKIGGEMISLPQIEEVLLKHFIDTEHARNQEGPCLAIEATPEETGSIITLFCTFPISLTEINTILRNSGLAQLYAVKQIRQLETIPLLGSGKTDYQSLKKLL